MTMLDEITYVYQAYAKGDLLLYVGITNDLDARIARHASDKFWWRRDVVRVSHVAFETRLEALWAEWAVIAMCHPVYNRRLSPPSMGVSSAQLEPAEAEAPDCFPPFARVVKFWETSPAPVEPSADERAQLNAGQQKVLAAIRAGHQQPKAIMAVTGYKTTHAHALINSLVEAGLISQYKYGRYQLVTAAA